MLTTKLKRNHADELALDIRIVRTCHQLVNPDQRTNHSVATAFVVPRVMAECALAHVCRRGGAQNSAAWQGPGFG